MRVILTLKSTVDTAAGLKIVVYTGLFFWLSMFQSFSHHFFHFSLWFSLTPANTTASYFSIAERITMILLPVYLWQLSVLP